MGYSGIIAAVIIALLVVSLFFIVREVEQKNWKKAVIYSVVTLVVLTIIRFVLMYMISLMLIFRCWILL